MSVLLFGQVHSLIVALERNNILLIWKWINEHKNLIPCPDSSNLQLEAICTVLGHLGRKGKSYKQNCDIITFCQFVSKHSPICRHRATLSLVIVFPVQSTYTFLKFVLISILAHNFVSWFGSEKYWTEFNRTPTNPFSIAIRFSVNIKNCLHNISWKQQPEMCSRVTTPVTHSCGWLVYCSQPFCDLTMALELLYRLGGIILLFGKPN